MTTLLTTTTTELVRSTQKISLLALILVSVSLLPAITIIVPWWWKLMTICIRCCFLLIHYHIWESRGKSLSAAAPRMYCFSLTFMHNTMCRDIWYPMAQLFTIQENEGENGKEEENAAAAAKTLTWERKLNVLWLFIISYHCRRRCFLLFLTLREKRLSWKNHSRNPFVFLSFIFEFISLRGPYRRLEPTGREFPRSSCARGIHSVVAAAKEFLIYVGLKHTHIQVTKNACFLPAEHNFPPWF